RKTSTTTSSFRSSRLMTVSLSPMIAFSPENLGAWSPGAIALLYLPWPAQTETASRPTTIDASRHLRVIVFSSKLVNDVGHEKPADLIGHAAVPGPRPCV